MTDKSKVIFGNEINVRAQRKAEKSASLTPNSRKNTSKRTV